MLAPYIGMVQSGEQLTLKFRIQLGATAAAPDFQVPAGTVKSATGAGSGVYTLTMREKYPAFIGGFGSYMCAAGDDARIVNIASPAAYDAATGILTFSLLDDDGDGTYTATDGVENDWVYLELTFVKKSQFAPTGAIPV